MICSYFEVHATIKIKIAAFWDETPCTFCRTILFRRKPLLPYRGLEVVSYTIKMRAYLELTFTGYHALFSDINTPFSEEPAAYFCRLLAYTYLAPLS